MPCEWVTDWLTEMWSLSIQAIPRDSGRCAPLEVTVPDGSWQVGWRRRVRVIATAQKSHPISTESPQGSIRGKALKLVENQLEGLAGPRVGPCGKWGGHTKNELTANLVGEHALKSICLFVLEK